MKSRFLNVSPRAFLRQKDSENILPPIKRSGYQNSTGISLTPFNDSDKTIVFNNSQILLAPYMISLSKASSSDFLTGSLLVTASLDPGVAYLDTAISDSDIVPFKEGSNPAAYRLGTENIGFLSKDYLGFSAPERDKSALVFDIGSNSDFEIIKINRGDAATDPSGPFFGDAGSGFLYYNHQNNSWEDVGLRDAASGATVDYDPILSMDHVRAVATPNSNFIVGGNERILSQFSSSPYSITSEGVNYVPTNRKDLSTRGYDKIGEPTSFFEAPYAPRYHARSGNGLKLSNYISAPFVVDRISVSLPVRAIRTQSPAPSTAPWSPGSVDTGFGRDIENYVFFVYVQNRSNAIKDSKQDVSSSIRYLVAKESFCFYNAQTLDSVNPGQAPIHSFSKSFVFRMAPKIAKTAGIPVSSVIDANIFMTFRPQTFSSVFGATSKLAASEDAPAPGASTIITGSVFVQHFWRGGQFGSGSTGRTGIVTRGAIASRNLNEMSGAQSPTMTNLLCNESPRSFVTSFWGGSSNTATSGSGHTEPNLEISTVSTYDSSIDTPVVLFPDDELVFGIESGVNCNLQSPGRQTTGVDTSVLDVTGSRLIIRSGDAKVVLYGSSIVDKIQSLPSLNQYLGSDAVHEAIQEQGPYDQFDTRDKSILSSSYVDNVFSGRMSTGAAPGWINGRRLAARGSQFQTSLTGSLQRNVRIQTESELYYDTLVPALGVLSKSLDGSSIRSSALTGQQILNLRQVSTFGYAVDNIRNSNVMLSRPFTYEKESGESRIKNISINFVDGSGNQTLVSGEAARFSLYYNGYIRTVNQPTTLSKQYTSGSASVRYGMLSPRLVGPSYVFRRDRYGNHRDMLEQSRDSRILRVAGSKDTVGTPVVQAVFVSQDSNTEVSPEQTQCSNLSIACTSSIPFIDDGSVHNRSALPSTTVRFGPNNLIFGITGSFGLQ